MGFSLRIEADYCNEVLKNIHPNGTLTSGKAVLAFLGGLQTYCSNDTESPNTQAIFEWYDRADQLAGEALCATCHVLIQSMWGSGMIQQNIETMIMNRISNEREISLLRKISFYQS